MLLTIVYLVIIWFLIKYLQGSISNNDNEFMSSSSITVYWFYSPGCSHCSNMKNSWDALVSSNIPNNYILKDINTIDPSNQDLAKKYNVQGVPHIIKVNANGKVISEYKGDRSTADMKKWVLK